MIVFQNNVIEEFDDLILSLYSRNYFSDVCSAESYVDKIIDFITESIAVFSSQRTPQELQHFDSKYISINPVPEPLGLLFLKTKTLNI